MQNPISNLEYGVWHGETGKYDAAFSNADDAFLWKFCQLKPQQFSVRNIASGVAIPDSLRNQKPATVIA